jgi:hypothetical protein
MAMFQDWSVCFPWLIIELGWSPKNFCHDIEAERSLTVEELEPWFANVIDIKCLHVDLAGYLLASFFFFFWLFTLSLMWCEPRDRVVTQPTRKDINSRKAK